MSDDDKQLTVAELLARAQKEQPDGDRPRRRRRRSLEEGGISVAELTGSIPKVEKRPVESKHSSVPIDGPVEAPKPKVEESKVEASKVEPKKPEAKAAEVKPAAPAQKASEAQKAAAPKPEVKQPEEKKPEPKAAPAPAAAAQAETKKPEQELSDETAQIKKVEETTQIKKVEDEPKAKGTKAAATKAAAVKTAPSVEETGEIGVVEDHHLEGREGTALEERHDAELDYEDYEESDEDSGKLNGLALVGLIIGGLILGVLVFLGFEYLWQNLNNWLVAVLAIVVTLVMVGVVKGMRTERDGFTMGLAGVVGLVMTFGPALLVFL